MEETMIDHKRNPMNSTPNRGNSRKEKRMNAITKATLVAILITLGLVPAAPVRAAETELVGAQTPWRVFLRMGPYVGRKDGTFLAPGGITALRLCRWTSSRPNS
jgi:hypothetical protein